MKMTEETDVPNKVILGASLVSILLSLMLVKRNPVIATFTGLWAPTFLGLGAMWNENRLLKLEQSHTHA